MNKILLVKVSIEWKSRPWFDCCVWTHFKNRAHECLNLFKIIYHSQEIQLESFQLLMSHGWFEQFKNIKPSFLIKVEQSQTWYFVSTYDREAMWLILQGKSISCNLICYLSLHRCYIHWRESDESSESERSFSTIVFNFNFLFPFLSLSLSFRYCSSNI